MKKVWKIAKHNGMLVTGDGQLEYRDELEQWLRVVYRDGSYYEEFAVAAGDAARLANLLNKAQAAIT